MDDDASPEPVPNPGFKPTLPATIIAPIRNTTLERMLLALSAKQRAQVVTAQSAVDRAQNLVAETSNELDDLSLRLKELAATRAGLEQQTEISRRALRSRGIRIYTGSNLGELDALLLAEDPSALARQIELLQQSQQREAAQLKRYAAQQSATEQAAEAAATLTASKQRELRRNLENQRALNDALTALQLAFAATNEGLALAINGWVFPVQPPFSFVDTFGAPRMFGTKYAHSHEGTDIFATEGTPLRAVARGVIARKGQAVLGGNKLWLVAADGTQYYYAHMSAFVEGVDEGTVVEAGQVIGFVGTTGNARGTPSHVHFEIHPLGGQAINPAPTLEAVRRSNANSPALPTNWNQPLTSPDSSTATTYRAGIGVTREYAIGAVDATAAGSRSTLPPGVSIPAPVRSIPG